VTRSAIAPEVERVDVLGVGVDALTIPLAVEVMSGWIARREPHYVCITGVHGVMESRRDAGLQRIHHGAGLVTPDGVPLVWLGRRRVTGGQRVERVYGPDLMLEVFDRSQATGWRHFLYGGSPESLALLEARLADRFPGAEVVGSISPPFRPLTPAEDEALTVQIASARPDVLWVGLGTPKQERWMAAHVERLGVPVIVGVGAAFDFHAGVKRQAPAVLQRAGLEWLFRLATEPRRLAGRYLRNNPQFAWLAGRDELRRLRPGGCR
jgi:N-acetylglucosaminyldiphosphoundecaprenol N-acetyl-beta-D-mannosaminyltransferase